jgi:hypothetical protein
VKGLPWCGDGVRSPVACGGVVMVSAGEGGGGDVLLLFLLVFVRE